MIKAFSQFRLWCHLAVKLNRWPYLLHPPSSKRVGDLGLGIMVYLTCTVIGLCRQGEINMDLSGCKVRLYTQTSNLTALFSTLFSHRLERKETDWHNFHFHFTGADIILLN